MKGQKGQIILLLILVMTVALAIGLSVIQRSLSDVSTSSKVDQSARAYFAAEAGIEKVLATGSTALFLLPNNSQVTSLTDSALEPDVPPVGDRQDPLEYPPLPKEDVVQVWLADLNSDINPPPAFYTQPTLEVYWGDSDTDKAALELTLVYYDGTQYKNRKWYLDHTITRSPDNKFTQVACAGYTAGTNSYQCKYTIGSPGDPDGVLPYSFPSILMLVRARLLYNNASQPFAVWAASACQAEPCRNYSLPPQARTITSTGVSGTTQRKVKLYQEYNVVPPEFDYAIFSSGAITK